MSPEVTSFQGDIPVKKSPMSLKFLPATASTDYSTDYSCVGYYFYNWQMSLVKLTEGYRISRKRYEK